MDIGSILAGLGGAATILKQVFDLFNSGLEATKNAQQTFAAGERLLQPPADTPETPEQATARARALADLLRSYALFGLLEYLLWATRATLAVVVFAQWTRFGMHLISRRPDRG